MSFIDYISQLSNVDILKIGTSISTNPLNYILTVLKDEKMNKHFLFITLTLSMSFSTLAQQYGTFKDSRDGKVYKTVKIGSQIWMAENLNADKFRNGDPIPKIASDSLWIDAGENQNPAYCYYENDHQFGIEYGKLYNGFVINDPRGLAPIGWHVASDIEWQTLIIYLGGSIDAGSKLKSSLGWNDEGNGSNASGFNGKPGGFRNLRGNFALIGGYTSWWSSTDFIPGSAWYHTLYYKTSKVMKYTFDKGRGMYVRCIKD